MNGLRGSEWSDSHEPSENSGGKLHELFNLKIKVFINEYSLQSNTFQHIHISGPQNRVLESTRHVLGLNGKWDKWKYKIIIKM